MTRFLPAICAFFVAASLHAQEPAGNPAPEDLRTLRQLIEQQSKQLERLTQEVARLIQIVDNGRAPDPVPAAQNVPPAAESSPAPAAVEIPKGQAVLAEGETQHIVAKGETLISIAKHNKVSVAEILKVNKIEDARKLQIGQTLTIPSSKPAEAPKQN